MYKNSLLANSVRFALISGAVATTAMTAPAAFAADETADVERIEVTGSRIKRSDLEGTSPVTVITAEDMKLEGITNVAVALQTMTAQSGGLTSSVNNGGNGKSSVNLRNLGSSRTLVLINGRRIANGGTGGNASVDLNEIPMAIVKRIEVLKDGASAVYGSDAIAGVVNIITKNDFEGVDINAHYGETFEGDGDEKSFDITFGTSSDKGNIVVNLGYYSRGEVRQGDRDFSDCPLWERQGEDGNMETYCGGSANVIGGAVSGSPGFIVFEPGGDGQSNPSGYHDFSNDDRYNYSALSYLDTPAERYSIGSNGSYELTDSVRTYFEANYTKRLSDQQMAPQPINGSVGESGRTFMLPINADVYPFMGLYDFAKRDGDTGADEEMFALRRMASVGPRGFKQSVDSVRLVLGFDGELENGWTWDAYQLFSRSDSSDRSENYINMDRVYRSIHDNCSGVTVSGTPGSYSVDGNNVDSPCINYMGSESLTASDAEYISYTDQGIGFNQMSITAISLAGEMFELPGGLAGFAVGYEYRRESGASSPDALTVSGVGSGNASEPTEGSFTVSEIFGEFNLPILDNLEVSAAVRGFDYDTFGSDYTWKLGAMYRPIESLTLRSVVSTAFRAPSIDDLFGGNSTGYPPYVDPCNNWGTSTAPGTNVYNNCMNEGLAPDFVAGNTQVDRSTSGGNEDLQPETADTFTFGFIYEPEFLEGFSMTADYYSIKMEDVIASVSAPTIINECYAAENGGIGGSSTWCNSLERNPIGTVSNVQATLANLSSWDVEGIDTNFSYNTDLAGMDLRLDWETSYYMTWDRVTFEGADVDDWVGEAGAIPEWKHTFAGNLRSDDWAANYTIRYIGEMIDPTVQDARTPEEREAAKNASADYIAEANWTHNASFTYFVSESLSLTAGVRNLFDETPAYYTSYDDANTDPYTYDVLGRRWFMNMNLSF